MFFKSKIINCIKNSIDLDLNIEITVDKTKIESFGDFSSNVAMKLAKFKNKNPVDLAEEIKSKIDDKFFSKIEVLSPGFINFFISDEAFKEYIKFLKSQNFEMRSKNGRRILIEYGSINPTGPLHVGHGRVIVFGDVIANLYKYSGYEVTREYYVNDCGNQIDNLALSLDLRARELTGSTIEWPAESYKGEYIKQMAEDFIKGYGTSSLISNDQNFIKSFALSWCISNAKNTLKKLNINYDDWVSEKSLYNKYPLESIINDLKAKDLAYEKEKAIWCKTTVYGDDKDRVAIKSDGRPAYYASDIVYSLYKSERKFNDVITVLGADHHGYVKRLESSFLFNGIKSFKTILVQMVQLFKNKELVKMSKRSGEFYTLDELIDEITGPVCRIFFLMRDGKTPLDFDIDLAKSQSDQNPYYYIQYASARIFSILNKNKLDIDKEVYLDKKEEKELLKKLDEFHEVIDTITYNNDVHLLINYLQDLTSTFHSYYNKYKIVSNEIEIMNSRLFLISKVREAISAILEIIGIQALDRM